MFGMLRPCRHSLPERLRTDWAGHRCGLCLALRDEHGQLARSRDQLRRAGELGPRRCAVRARAGPCPLRGFRTADVAHGDDAGLAAAVSLMPASAKLADHAADGDGALTHRTLVRAANRLSRRWADRAAVGSDRLGFPVGVLLDAVARQPAVEKGRPASLLTVTEPTETATAAACTNCAGPSTMPSPMSTRRDPPVRRDSEGW